MQWLGNKSVVPNIIDCIEYRGDVEKCKWSPEAGPCTPYLMSLDFVPKVAVGSLHMLTPLTSQPRGVDTTIVLQKRKPAEKVQQLSSCRARI